MVISANYINLQAGIVTRSYKSLKIGVLALQGDFAEHVDMLKKLKNLKQDKYAGLMEDLDGLIIPGGESTAIARLSLDNPDPIFDVIRKKAVAGMPIYGTCMGSILLAKEIEGSTQGKLALMDIKVKRNAFGPQKFSGEVLLNIEALGTKPYPAVFIRAPIILSCKPNVQILATMEGTNLNKQIVMARQNNLLVSVFHPEITDDDQVHKYFLDMVLASK